MNARSAVRPPLAGRAPGRWLLLSLCALLAGLPAACVSTATLSRFDAFAQVGAQYVQAVDALLVQAGQIQVDTTSEKLLATRSDFGPVPRDAFRQQDKADRAYLQEISLLRRQVQLLRDYFSALDALATSKNPEAFASTLSSTAGSLNTLSQELRGRSLAQNPAAVQALASGVGSLVVRQAESRALQRELEQRKETIAQVLLLHEALLGVLRDQVEANAQFTGNREYEQDVEQPYLTTGAPLDPTSWTQERYKGLSPPDPVQQLTAAESAARNLRAAWAKLLSNQLTPGDIAAVTSDLQPILAALNAL